MNSDFKMALIRAAAIFVATLSAFAVAANSPRYDSPDWPVGSAVNADTNLWLPQSNDSLWSSQDTADCIGDSGLEYSNALHPSVCKFRNGFGSHGWKYVIAYTPICVSDKDENPHIAVSFNHRQWFSPFVGADSTTIFEGTDSSYAIGYHDSTLSQPLFYPSAFGGGPQDYISDCDLFNIEDTLLCLAFRFTKDRSPRDSSFLMLVHSHDLVNWSKVDTVLADTESFISPSFVVSGNGSIDMWCVEFEPNGILPDSTMVTRYRAVDIESPFVLQDTVGFQSNPGRDVWHLSIVDLGFGNILCLATEDTLDGLIGGDGADFSLYTAYSADSGHTFVTFEEPLLSASASGWDDSYIYRSDGVWSNSSRQDTLELFYAASGQSGWHTGLTYAVFPSCCSLRGDIDHSGNRDITDLTTFVDYLFGGGPISPCPEESDVDHSGSVDITDLTFLVDYLFGGGPPPPGC